MPCRIFLLIISVLFLSWNARAQQESIPVQFGQFNRCYPLINPASAGSYSKAEFNTGVQRQGGNWSNINTYYFNANIRLTKDRTQHPDTTFTPDVESESQEDSLNELIIIPYSISLPGNYHVTGFTLNNDKEGIYLNRVGVYGLYAWHTRIFRTTYLSAGTTLGIKNYSVDASYANGGGSDFAPDGNAGLWLYDLVHNYQFGISAGQIFNSSLTPIRETTKLTPLLNITASKLWQTHPYFAWRPSLLLRLPQQQQADLHIAMGGLFYNFVSATVSYRTQRGLTNSIGLEKLDIGNGRLKAAFSYYIPLGKSQLNINTYEVTLNYYLKSNRTSNDVVFQ